MRSLETTIAEVTEEDKAQLKASYLIASEIAANKKAYVLGEEIVKP